MTKTKLVIGHAGRRHPDAVTLDIDPAHHPDVVHDLNRLPWPFQDNQFLEIACHHVLEHLNDLPPVMNELYRICSADGVIDIEVPHYSAWLANSPEHKLRFGYFGFDAYLTNGVTDWLSTQKFALLSREVTFHRAFRRLFLHRLFNRFPLAYERFWVYLAPAEHLKVRLRPVKS